MRQVHLPALPQPHGRYANPLDIDGIRRLGLEVVDARLADADDPEKADPRKVAALLLSLA